MIGLIYLVMGFVYLLLSIWLVVLAVRAARRRGRAGWKWGLGVGLVMYLLVFWDWIPTVVAQKYYCSRYAGFTQYKSVDQWKDENPLIAKTLKPSEEVGMRKFGAMTKYDLNQRFWWEVSEQKVFLNIVRVDEFVVDKKTGEKLAQYIDFNNDLTPLGVGAGSIKDYKIWMEIKSCESNKKSEQKNFSLYQEAIKHIGD